MAEAECLVVVQEVLGEDQVVVALRVSEVEVIFCGVLAVAVVWLEN